MNDDPFVALCTIYILYVIFCIDRSVEKDMLVIFSTQNEKSLLSFDYVYWIYCLHLYRLCYVWLIHDDYAKYWCLAAPNWAFFYVPFSQKKIINVYHSDIIIGTPMEIVQCGRNMVCVIFLKIVFGDSRVVI